MRPFSVYINLPTSLGRMDGLAAFDKSYISAILSEIEFWASQPEWQDRKLTSIYLGGGGALDLCVNEIRQIIFYLCNQFSCNSNIEITVESDGRILNTPIWDSLVASGVSRVSLRASSFGFLALPRTERLQNIRLLSRSIELMHKAGVDSVNVDFAYGLASKSVSDFREDLADLLELGPDHISAYYTAKPVEPKNLHRSHISRASLKEELLLKMVRVLDGYLETGGFEKYQLNDFALPGAQCNYTKLYWSGGDYIGIGCGAHSRFSNTLNDRIEWFNFDPIDKYIAHAKRHKCSYCVRHVLALSDLMFEFFALGFRTVSGVSREEFKVRFGKEIEVFYPNIVSILEDAELVKASNNNIQLTDLGFLHIDEVLDNFVYSSTDQSVPSIRTAIMRTPTESKSSSFSAPFFRPTLN